MFRFWPRTSGVVVLDVTTQFKVKRDLARSLTPDAMKINPNENYPKNFKIKFP